MEEVLEIISLGLKVRATHETKMNQVITRGAVGTGCRSYLDLFLQKVSNSAYAPVYDIDHA